MTRQLHSKTRFLLNFQIIRTASEPAAAWNAKLRELSKQGQFEEGLGVYRQMLRSGATPNAFTFPFVLKSSAALSLTVAGELLHCHVVKSGCEPEPFVTTALISMYCKCGLVKNAYKVFDQSPQSRKLTVCYNALIAGYVKNSDFRNGCLLFREMRSMGVAFSAVTMLGLVPGCTAPMLMGVGMSLHSLNIKCGLYTDLAVLNCLLTMYVKCGSIELARKLFDHIPEKGLITWNAMITGCAQNGLAALVLELYCKMELSGICPDAMTFVAVLSACANLGAQRTGFEVEQKIESCGLRFNTFLKNALINMYARCGKLARAQAIFDDMPEKNMVSWTAIIGGYGMHGLGETATELFDEMINSGVKPDGTVFVSILSACSHAGLTDKGLTYLAMMERDFGLKPGSEHYSCIVDLLGRAGRLQEAFELIADDMKVEPDGAVWGALLGACKIHKNVELAEIAFNKVVELEPMNTGYYILLSNIYTEAKNSEGIQRVRVMMRDRKLKKDPGYSYVELKGKIHLFVAADRSHPQLKAIHDMLERLEESLKALGGPEKIEEEIMNQEHRNSSARLHSERLAIAFALLNTNMGADILVIKNLRICADCHFFLREVTKVLEDRLFVVRDATRFHHFRNGACSCNDYW